MGEPQTHIATSEKDYIVCKRGQLYVILTERVKRSVVT
jgi:hypothetical protein